MGRLKQLFKYRDRNKDVRKGKACNRCGHTFEVGEMKHYLESDWIGFMCGDCRDKSPDVYKG